MAEVSEVVAAHILSAAENRLETASNLGESKKETMLRNLMTSGTHDFFLSDATGKQIGFHVCDFFSSCSFPLNLYLLKALCCSRKLLETVLVTLGRSSLFNAIYTNM